MKNEDARYRHELKYFIGLPERQAMVGRLQSFLQKDQNGGENGYCIRSLYFDDYWNSAYSEKMAGVAERNKWRIRIYDYSDQVIKLECKKKTGTYIHKEAASLSREETERILRGEYDFLLQRQEDLCRRFYVECTSSVMRPKVIVDYERTAFVYRAGDVRLTFDSDVRCVLMSNNLFDDRLPSLSVLEPGKLILEIKYTEFLPELVRRAVSPRAAEFTAASKYTLCCEKKMERTAGNTAE